MQNANYSGPKALYCTEESGWNGVTANDGPAVGGFDDSGGTCSEKLLQGVYQSVWEPDHGGRVFLEKGAKLKIMDVLGEL